tara:strand:+ start:646 stop:1353 length:708 start_codon:yes stop_codon:yes gene_type:complete
MARGKIYFGQPTEDAIIEYNAEESPIVRNQIYNERIRKPLEKLVENIIHTFKFYYFDVPSEDVKHEVVSNLIINMHKYKQEKGRAFSYFSIVAKNYLILHNNNNYKKMKQQNDIQVADFERNIQNELDDEKYQEGNSELLDFYCEYLENNISNIFTRKKDIDVAYSVLYLLQNLHNIENFNKKYLYLQIREMTSSNTQHITRVITQLKKYFEEIKLEFYAKGEVDTSFTGSFFDA